MRHRKLVSASAALVLAFGTATLRAQPGRDLARTLPVDSILARFAADRIHNRLTHVAYDVLELPHSYATRQDSLLDGLERLAAAGDRYVASSAASMVAFAGQAHDRGAPLAGIVPRLARMYRVASSQRDDAGVQRAIRASLPLQADRNAAAALLRSIAAEHDSRGPDPVHGYVTVGEPRVEALARLAEMGETGRTVLQEMYRRGEARSPQARMVLEQMARRGFPVADAVRKP